MTHRLKPFASKRLKPFASKSSLAGYRTQLGASIGPTPLMTLWRWPDQYLQPAFLVLSRYHIIVNKTLK